MNLREFKKRLANHDWYYSQSEDLKLYNKGLAEEKALLSMCHGRKTYKKAYESLFDKYFKKKKHGSSERC